MQMNALFGTGLFENPWVVAVLLIVGAVANWLAKRRQEKQAEHPPESEETPSSGRPAGETNLEEALRRLMGEEPSAPVPAPPPIPGALRGELQPVPDWQEEELRPTARQTTVLLRPPRIPVAQASINTTAASEQQEQAARRFEQLNEQGRHPATVVGHVRTYRSRAGKRTASRWRNPRSARQAFVAAMVFAPPKSLEP